MGCDFAYLIYIYNVCSRITVKVTTTKDSQGRRLSANRKHTKKACALKCESRLYITTSRNSFKRRNAGLLTFIINK